MGVTLLLIIFKGWGKKKKKKKTGKEKLPMLHQQHVWTWFLEQENLHFLKVVQLVFLDGVYLPFRTVLLSTVTKDNSVTLSHASALLKTINSLLPAFSLKRKKGGGHTPQTNPNQICIIFFFSWLADFQDKEDRTLPGTAAGACSPNSQKRTPHTEGREEKK